MEFLYIYIMSSRLTKLQYWSQVSPNWPQLQFNFVDSTIGFLILYPDSSAKVNPKSPCPQPYLFGRLVAFLFYCKFDTTMTLLY